MESLPGVWDFPILKYFFFITFIWIIIYVCFRFYDYFSKSSNFDLEVANSRFIFLISISIVGLSIGLIAGNSRNGITDVIVSSVLTVVAGLISTAFIKQHLSNEVN